MIKNYLAKNSTKFKSQSGNLEAGLEPRTIDSLDSKKFENQSKGFFSLIEKENIFMISYFYFRKMNK